MDNTIIRDFDNFSLKGNFNSRTEYFNKLTEYGNVSNYKCSVFDSKALTNLKEMLKSVFEQFIDILKGTCIVILKRLLDYCVHDHRNNKTGKLIYETFIVVDEFFWITRNTNHPVKRNTHYHTKCSSKNY